MKNDSTASASRRAKGEHGVPARASGPPPALEVERAAARQPTTPKRSYQGCYQHFSEVAARIPAAEVIAFPGDARLALVNVRVALANVCADPAAVAEELSKLPVHEAAEAADVARAVVYIDTRVQSERQASAAPNAALWRATLSRCAKRRRGMLSVARELADKGLLPAQSLAALGRRSGVASTIGEADILCELFTTHAAAIEGQHPYTAADLKTLRADVEWLRENTTPRGARKVDATKRTAAAQERDQLWTLLVRRHALLQRIGGYFHGVDVVSVVPPLRSRTHDVARTSEDEGDPTKPSTG